MDFTMNFLNIAFIVLILIVIGLAGYVVYLHNKLKKFLIGSSSNNLDDSITSINNSINELEKSKTEIENYLTTVEKRLKKSVQAVHTVRFNPFKGTGSGSNQSFATVFLSEDNDGVIISSLYSREHVSVYSKPIKKGSSEYEFSEEEKTALLEAQKLVK